MYSTRFSGFFVGTWVSRPLGFAGGGATGLLVVEAGTAVEPVAETEGLISALVFDKADDSAAWVFAASTAGEGRVEFFVIGAFGICFALDLAAAGAVDGWFRTVLFVTSICGLSLLFVAAFLEAVLPGAGTGVELLPFWFKFGVADFPELVIRFRTFGLGG